MQGRLLLVRHGESEWNALNLFTGWKDVGLSEQGQAEAYAAGRLLVQRSIVPDEIHTSVLRRAIDTATAMMEKLEGGGDIPMFRDAALNERDYGDLTGMNKDDARKRWGKEQVHIWRRSYDVAPPGGESLQDTLKRVRVYYEEKILPGVLDNKTLLVAAHGNSLRSMMVLLEGLGEKEIQGVEINTGEVLMYELEKEGKIAGKERLRE